MMASAAELLRLAYVQALARLKLYEREGIPVDWIKIHVSPDRGGMEVQVCDKAKST